MKVKDFYNKFASDYEKIINSDEVNAQFMKYLEEIFSKYNIIKGTILDVGCGPGNLKTTLGPKFDYTGIDVSENMLRLAKKVGYKTILGALEEKLPKIASKSFDYVSAISSLYFVKDVGKAIAEFDRIAKKGWIVSLDDIPKGYIKNVPITEPIYNHFATNLEDTTEDLCFRAWTSPTTGDVINARMIFKKF